MSGNNTKEKDFIIASSSSHKNTKTATLIIIYIRKVTRVEIFRKTEKFQKIKILVMTL